MDLYDVIPEGHDEEVRKRIREREECQNQKSPSKWRRTDYKLSPPTDLEPVKPCSPPPDLLPPKPKDSLDAYNRQRLERGLTYINHASKRKITSRTQTFFRLQKEAYKIALNTTPPEPTSLAVVQALDRVYYSESFYLGSRTTEEHERLMMFVKLRQLELLANYGDYLGQELQEFRADMKEAAKGGSEEVRNAYIALKPPQTWLNIADVLGLRAHLLVACGISGIDSQHMMCLIEQWGDKNHSTIQYESI